MNKISYCSCILIDLLNFNFLNLILVFFSNYNLKKIIASIFLQTADSPIREIVVLEKSIINNVSKKFFFCYVHSPVPCIFHYVGESFLRLKTPFRNFHIQKVCLCGLSVYVVGVEKIIWNVFRSADTLSNLYKSVCVVCNYLFY